MSVRCSLIFPRVRPVGRRCRFSSTTSVKCSLSLASWALLNRKLGYVIMDDLFDVEDDRAFDSLTQGLGPDPPAGGKPAGRALHAHTELGKAASILRNGCGSESTRVVPSGDSTCIVSYDETRCRAIVKLDAHPQFQTRPVDRPQLIASLNKALNGVINELGDREPWPIIEVPEDA